MTDPRSHLYKLGATDRINDLLTSIKELECFLKSLRDTMAVQQQEKRTKPCLESIRSSVDIAAVSQDDPCCRREFEPPSISSMDNLFFHALSLQESSEGPVDSTQGEDVDFVDVPKQKSVLPSICNQTTCSTTDDGIGGASTNSVPTRENTPIIVDTDLQDSSLCQDQESFSSIDSLPLSNTTIVLTPQIHDVLLGGDPIPKNHVGNVHFRRLIQLYQEDYIQADFKTKRSIATSIVKRIQVLDPPGRFLVPQRHYAPSATATQMSKKWTWTVLSDAMVIDKTMSLLREERN